MSWAPTRAEASPLDLLATNLILANNIIAFNSGGIYQYPGQSPPMVFRDNCLTNPVNYVYLSPGAGDIHLDPQFTNPAAGDFHLLGTSPCIDAGTATNAPATDKDGIQRPLDGKNSGVPAFDIGAYEYVNPHSDTDHDGMPDWAELIAGTDPTDPTSVLKLQARPAASGAVGLDWLSAAGRTYTLLYTTALPGGAWQTLSNGIPGTGASLEVVDSPGANRIYRLQVVKNPP